MTFRDDCKIEVSAYELSPQAWRAEVGILRVSDGETLLARTTVRESANTYPSAASALEAARAPTLASREAGLLAAALNKRDGRIVVDGIGVDAADERDVIGDLRSMRQDLGQLYPTLTMFRILELRAEQRRVWIDERRAIPLEKFGRWQLSIAFGQFGLVVEQFQVAGSAGLEDVDDPLGLAGKVWLFGSEGICGPSGTGHVGGKQRSL